MDFNDDLDVFIFLNYLQLIVLALNFSLLLG